MDGEGIVKQEQQDAWDAYIAAANRRKETWDAYEKLHKRTQAAQKREDVAYEAWSKAVTETDAAAKRYNETLRVTP
jgi:hypothetical protein